MGPVSLAATLNLSLIFYKTDQQPTRTRMLTKTCDCTHTSPILAHRAEWSTGTCSKAQAAAATRGTSVGATVCDGLRFLAEGPRPRELGVSSQRFLM